MLVTRENELDQNKSLFLYPPCSIIDIMIISLLLVSSYLSKPHVHSC